MNGLTKGCLQIDQSSKFGLMILILVNSAKMLLNITLCRNVLHVRKAFTERIGTHLSYLCHN